MVKEFRQFLMRGSVVDLAVAVVIGAAFGLLINSLVKDLINPLIAAIIGKPDFSDLTFTIRDATFRYGAFITALINFVLVAAAIFFLVVKPMNAAATRFAAPVVAAIVPADAPMVVGNSVYLTDKDGNLKAYDTATGQPRWRVAGGAELTGSPTLVDGVLYAVNASNELVAVDATTGAELWRRAAG